MVKNRFRVLSLALLICLCTGCSTIGYYHQSVSGHLSLISKRKPIADIVNDSSRDKKLIEQLVLAQELRTFASTHLKLPENDSYRSYVQLDRPYVVWSVFAAPEFSVRLKNWCFPVVGCLKYRGYFDRNEAHAYAAKLADLGLDVYVSGVPAYSTLGWFDDPLLSTMLNRGELVTATYIFHELAHQQFYLKGDTGFNEAFATAVEELGVNLWLQHRGQTDARLRYENWLTQKKVFSDLVRQTRQEFRKLYARDLPAEAMRSEKRKMIADLRKRFEDLARHNDQLLRYRKWMSGPLNNAQLGARALYRDLTPVFKRLFHACGRDFTGFYQRVEEISELSEEKRKQVLTSHPKC